ncbi:MAG TPA: response regulator transcription factor [Aggregatilinea sp.]|uniref:response regulator transcription factor n=1 Tax=Aggregatilinea sp. TaxID=2806333 RepID=UPI002CC247B4|nr:response regulator transcription factor [Aggregatilinea sp.]HML20915.1 response regulator transcription factor [Aggregatilinea sp.]
MLESRVRVVLVDDHQMVRQGLIFFLSTQPGIEVAGQAASGEEALALVEELRPDVVLMDIVLPGLGGIEALRQITETYPGINVIVLSSFIDDTKLKQAIQAGAAGYLMKDVDPEELAEAIHATQRGEMYLHPKAARRLAEMMRPGPDEQQEPSPEVLTERELQVLELVTRGLSNQEIATELNITLKTVKAHVSSILQKLGLENRVQATLYALRHQIVELD